MNQSSEGTSSPARSRRESACCARGRTSPNDATSSGGSDGGSGNGTNAATVSPATVLLRVSPTILATPDPPLGSDPLPALGESKGDFPFGARYEQPGILVEAEASLYDSEARLPRPRPPAARTPAA